MEDPGEDIRNAETNGGTCSPIQIQCSTICVQFPHHPTPSHVAGDLALEMVAKHEKSEKEALAAPCPDDVSVGQASVITPSPRGASSATIAKQLTCTRSVSPTLWNLLPFTIEVF